MGEKTGQIMAHEGVNARKCHGNQNDDNWKREQNWKLNDIPWKRDGKWKNVLFIVEKSLLSLFQMSQWIVDGAVFLITIYSSFV